MPAFNLANIFGGGTQKPAAVDPAAPANTPKNQPQGEQSNQLEQGKQGNQPTTGTQTQVKDPLAPFADLWDAPKAESDPGNTPNDPNKVAPKSPDFAVAAKKLDFSRLVHPDLATKALGGDTTAFNQILNTIGQAGFAAAGKMTEGMIAKAIKDSRTEIDSSLAGRFKELAVSNTRSKNPNLQHKAVKPMVEAIKLQISQKFSDASPEEIQTKAEEYVSAMLAAVNSGSASDTDNPETDPLKEKAKAQATGTYDWDKFVMGE